MLSCMFIHADNNNTRVCPKAGIENVTLDDGIQLHARQLLYTVKIV